MFVEGTDQDTFLDVVNFDESVGVAYRHYLVLYLETSDHP